MASLLVKPQSNSLKMSAAPNENVNDSITFYKKTRVSLEILKYCLTLATTFRKGLLPCFAFVSTGGMGASTSQHYACPSKHERQQHGQNKQQQPPHISATNDTHLGKKQPQAK